MTLTALFFVCMLVWAAVLLAPWRPWSTAERLEAGVDGDDDLSDVTAIIPARNEAGRIAGTLKALHAQGRDLQIIVVDDGSDDGTAEVIEGLALDRVRLLRAGPLPSGWTGKVWAQSQAESLLERPLLLLLDADIRLSPDLLPALKEKLVMENLALASLMAELPMKDFWERLLIPPFIFFFKLLYPFGRVGARESRVAAAAGGCVLMKRRVLEEIGGLAALRDAIIDDCTLARRVKDRGHRIWIGLTRSAVSTRRYRGLSDIWNMVARTAYTQLGYSPAMLALCTLAMAGAFVAPVLGLFANDGAQVVLSALAVAFMLSSYLPLLRFYGLNPVLCLTLPIAGVLFLAMTWTSAIRYWSGQRSAWHGRAYRA